MMEEIINSRWIEIVDMFRTEISNINAGEGGPNEIELKVIHLEDGTIVPRISPQAIMRMIRDYWEKIGKDVLLSNKLKNKDQKELITSDIDEEIKSLKSLGKKARNGSLTKEDREKIADILKSIENKYTSKFIDADLFGYMLPIEGISAAIRSGPVRSIGARGLFEYPDDYDFMTSIISTTGKSGGGSIIKKQITTNTFILPFWINVDRIRHKDNMKYLFESIFYLGKDSLGNFRMPLEPKMLVIAGFKKPNCMLYDSIIQGITTKVKDIKLQKEYDERSGTEKLVSIVSGKILFNFDPSALLEKLEYYGNDVSFVKIGYMKSFFDRELQIEHEKVEIVPLSELKKSLLGGE